MFKQTQWELRAKHDLLFDDSMSNRKYKHVYVFWVTCSAQLCNLGKPKTEIPKNFLRSLFQAVEILRHCPVAMRMQLNSSCHNPQQSSWSAEHVELSQNDPKSEVWTLHARLDPDLHMFTIFQPYPWELKSHTPIVSPSMLWSGHFFEAVRHRVLAPHRLTLAC